MEQEVQAKQLDIEETRETVESIFNFLLNL